MQAKLPTVLIVEDEEKVASFLKQALEESGYAADVARDGQAGLDWARQLDDSLRRRPPIEARQQHASHHSVIADHLDAARCLAGRSR